MNQTKMGNFIKELRKEKELTQEQLAEIFHVARRTVSRWETGSNMPDMDILIEMSDFFEVDLREILDGERKNKKMDSEMKETVLKVAEYSNIGQKKMARIVLIYFILGIVALVIHTALEFIELEGNFWTEFLDGATIGMAVRRHIVGGANRTLISVITPFRLCRIGTCRRLSSG